MGGGGVLDPGVDEWNAATRYCNMTASNTLYHELWKMQCKQMLQFTVLNMDVSELLLASANESHRSGTVARAVASDVLRCHRVHRDTTRQVDIECCSLALY